MYWFNCLQLENQGVQINSAKIESSTGEDNTLNTFWMMSDLDLSNGLDFSDRGAVYVRFTHLNHRPFRYVYVLLTSYIILIIDSQSCPGRPLGVHGRLDEVNNHSASRIVTINEHLWCLNAIFVSLSIAPSAFLLSYDMLNVPERNGYTIPFGLNEMLLFT